MPQSTQQLAKTIRIHALKMVHRANASHIGSSLSMADMLAVLYVNVLRFDAAKPGWPERDVLLLSKGHACAIMYAVLAEMGYFDVGLLETFGQNGTILQGHASCHVPGIELSTGSLGHALPVACGLAVAALRENNPRRIFVILSDGELDEGSNWEAMLFAGHHRLHNLTVIVDYNKIQSFGTVKEVLDLEPLADKWRACRWQVKDINGHDHAALKSALGAPDKTTPNVVIANTVKGKGVRFMEDSLQWHYKSPSAEQLQQAISELEQTA